MTGSTRFETRMFGKPRGLGLVLTLTASLVCAVGWQTPLSASPTTDSSIGEDSTNSEEASLKHPRVVLNLGWSYGVSYGDSMIAAAIPIGTPEYYDLIGMQASTNLLDLQLSGLFTLREGSTWIFVSVPFGMVQKAASSDSLPGLIDTGDFQFAIGEISFGLTHQLIHKERGRPGLSVRLDGSTGNASFSSLGDGFRSLGATLSSEKRLSKRTFLTAQGSYTHRFDEGPVVAGAIVGLGGGLGRLTASGAHRIDVGVGVYQIGATGLPRNIRLPEGDENAVTDHTTYRLSVGLQRAGTRHHVSLDLYAPEGKFGLKENSISMQYTMPLRPRERWRVRSNKSNERKGLHWFPRWLRKGGRNA